MSIYSKIGSSATKYFNLLNAESAVNMVKWGGAAGYLRGVAAGGTRSGVMRGASGAAMGLKGWAWPTKGADLAAKRATRVGTMAAGAFVAGNFVNPRDNFGPF